MSQLAPSEAASRRRIRWKRWLVGVIVLAAVGWAWANPREARWYAGESLEALEILDRELLGGAFGRGIDTRTQAVEAAWGAAPTIATRLTWSAAAAWSGNSAMFAATPAVVVESDADRLLNFAVDAAYMAATGTVAWAGGYAACQVVGEAITPGLGTSVSGLCGAAAVMLTTDLRRSVHMQLLERPIAPGAELAGALVGVMVGTPVAIRLLKVPGGDYAAYERAARGLTERTMRASGQSIDPQGLRGAAHHLDHIISVKCGYLLGIPPALIAAGLNLRIIEAQANMALGAKGC